MIANAVTASRLVLAVPLWLLMMAEGTAARWAALGVLPQAGVRVGPPLEPALRERRPLPGAHWAALVRSRRSQVARPPAATGRRVPRITNRWIPPMPARVAAAVLRGHGRER